eukprot:CAMPEP_0198657608 /NCGR_PEP_ID=MMETSP1467-20131203/17598_1 /TAXON_ID=1462469 /ORGANISM="unid. sp., Strain CCMP2135" /LENGTH=317 /DNA_ID=CAMNT_0044393809 /DNA_START=1 /DNA_END=954 /DNA_ORIENTATION=+
MGLTAFYVDKPVSDEKCMEVLKCAYDTGCRHFDTAEAYVFKSEDGNVYNEAVLGKFLKTVPRDSYTVATKFRPGLWECDYDGIKASLTASLERLGLEYVDLYYAHRVLSLDMAVAFGKVASKLKEEGLIKNVGYSEIIGAWLKECHAITPVAAVQQEWSLLTRSLEPELVPVCKELGVTVVAYSPLARNLLSGLTKEPPADWRASNPRYSPENLKKNNELISKVAEIAKKYDCTAAQLSLAWLFFKAKQLGVAVVPIPGTTNLTNLADNLAATDIALSDDDMTLLEGIADQVAGDRGNSDYMARGIESHLQTHLSSS